MYMDCCTRFSIFDSSQFAAICTFLEQSDAETVRTCVQVPEERQVMLADFLSALFKLYVDLNFVYMEINPIVVVGERITPLDMAAKIDETASFLCGPKWGEIDFPAPFGEKGSFDLDDQCRMSARSMRHTCIDKCFQHSLAETAVLQPPGFSFRVWLAVDGSFSMRSWLIQIEDGVRYHPIYSGQQSTPFGISSRTSKVRPSFSSVAFAGRILYSRSNIAFHPGNVREKKIHRVCPEGKLRR